MNKRARQRLIGVTILIVVAVVALITLTKLGGGTATPASIEQVMSDKELVGKQVEVSGKVVAGSWVSGSKPFTFEIEDDKADGRVKVVWDDVVPGSFGDGTSATVTGTLGQDGSIQADYLVTKCPSKYESATGSLTVSDVVGRSAEIKGVTVKVSGFVVKDSIGEAGAPVRFQVSDSVDGSNALDVAYGGGLPDTFKPGVKVVLTGSLEDGTFVCSDVALDESAR